MFLRALRSFDQLPAFVECNGCRNFSSHVLLVVHSVYSHRRMPFPWSTDIDEVDIISFTQSFPCFFAPRIFCSRRPLHAGYCLLRCLHLVGIFIGNGNDLQVHQDRRVVSTASDPRFPSPMMPTRTVSIFGAAYPHILNCWDPCSESIGFAGIAHPWRQMSLQKKGFLLPVHLYQSRHGAGIDDGSYA